MKIKDNLKKIRDNYVINHVKKTKIPEFDTDDIGRARIIFCGRVQKVGFRLEVSELAKRLELTGFCKNLDNGDVLVEVQGYINKIIFLLIHMERLKRAKVTKIRFKALTVDETETAFLIL